MKFFFVILLAITCLNLIQIYHCQRANNEKQRHKIEEEEGDIDNVRGKPSRFKNGGKFDLFK